MEQFWRTGHTLSVPVMSTASLKPVMSTSIFKITALRPTRKVGQLARWSILVSPSWPDPLSRMRFVILMVSLHILWMIAGMTGLLLLSLDRCHTVARIHQTDCTKAPVRTRNVPVMLPSICWQLKNSWCKQKCQWLCQTTSWEWGAMPYEWQWLVAMYRLLQEGWYVWSRSVAFAHHQCCYIPHAIVNARQQNNLVAILSCLHSFLYWSKACFLRT